MKEEAVTSSFDNPKRLSAIIMIILNRKKINTNFIEILQNYINLINFGYLECPHCHSNNIIKWGTYNRNVIFFSFDNISLKSFVFSIQRVKCKSCGKTHALLPFGVIPYKQFTSNVIIKILNELLHTSLEKLSIKYSINISILKKWKRDFKSYHLPRLTTLMSNKNISNILNIFSNDINIQKDYIVKNKFCFMQIKLSLLTLCPS